MSEWPERLSTVQGKDRMFFLGAVDVDWDYAPKGGHTTNVAHNADFYLKGGAVYKGKDNGYGAAVPPGGIFEYEWKITKAAGPAQGDNPCIPWPFHSHGENPDKDINTGLIGVIIVCKPGVLNDKGERKDVQQEFVVLMKVFDENRSWHTKENLDWCGDKEKCKELLEKGDLDFLASNYMHALNGYVFAHGAPFSMCGNDAVVWHVLGFGGELDLHSFTVDGEMLTIGTERVISAEVLPGTFVTATMTATTPGKKLAFCAVSSHLEEGMSAFIDVHDCGVQAAPLKAGKTRKYYLMIDEVIWDYAPTGMDLYSGKALVEEHSTQAKYFTAGSKRIGGMYKKYMYFQYEDEHFTKRIYRYGSDKHLGILGPVIRAEGGDKIEVLLYNNGTKPFSFFPYGLWPAEKNVDKGGLHNVATEPKSKHAYIFTVPPTAPEAGQHSPPCSTSMYQSAVDPVRDLHTGLVGPLLLCQPHTLDKEGNQKDVEERILYLSVMDENLSWLIDDNIKQFTIPHEVDRYDWDFWEANRMHSINGLSYGNMYGLDFCKGTTVSWHLFALGDESDVQGVHFHGLNFELSGKLRDTLSLFPGTTASIKTKINHGGTWVIQSTNTDHFEAGLFCLYGVDDCDYSSHRMKRATGHSSNSTGATGDAQTPKATGERRNLRTKATPRGHGNGVSNTTRRGGPRNAHIHKTREDQQPLKPPATEGGNRNNAKPTATEPPRPVEAPHSPQANDTGFFLTPLGKVKPETYKAEVAEKKEGGEGGGEGKKKKKEKAEPGVRKFFIAAEEVDWDFSPPWNSMKDGR
nr:hypothetical protein BaRGS_013565 [Batillaria attramentaria]